MIINIKKLVEEIEKKFPSAVAEVESEKGFSQIIITGESGNKIYLYPNDEAWFVKMYPTHEDYQRYALESIRQALVLD